MHDLITFLTSDEIMLVYIVGALALVIGIGFYFLNKTYERRAQKNNTRELNKLVEQVSEVLEEDSSQIEVLEDPALDATSAIINDVEEVELKSFDVPLDSIKAVEEVVIPYVPTVVSTEDIIKPEIKVEEVLPKVEEIKVEEINPEALAPIKEVQEIIEYEPIEKEQTVAQAELKKLTEELAKAEEVAGVVTLTNFEQEQEENAIISLDELLKKSKTMYQSAEIDEYEDDTDAPISIFDLEKKMLNKQETITVKEENMDIEEKVVMDDFNTISVNSIKKPESSNKKFTSSPIISPIYGIEGSHVTEDSLELENTANYDKLDEEIRKTNEFIMTLKELQSKLD